VAHKNDTPSFSRKWMELEDIVLSEITQVQKDKYQLFSFE
jgi:hypothetical protein